MSTAVSYPHIDKPEGQPARLRSHPRVRVAQIVMDYLFHGWSPDEMCRQHPYLTLAEAHAAMCYYYDNRDEIEREIRDEIALVGELRAQAPPSRLALELRAKGLL